MLILSEIFKKRASPTNQSNPKYKPRPIQYISKTEAEIQRNWHEFLKKNEEETRTEYRIRSRL